MRDLLVVAVGWLVGVGLFVCALVELGRDVVVDASLCLFLLERRAELVEWVGCIFG